MNKQVKAALGPWIVFAIGILYVCGSLSLGYYLGDWIVHHLREFFAGSLLVIACAVAVISVHAYRKAAKEDDSERL